MAVVATLSTLTYSPALADHYPQPTPTPKVKHYPTPSPTSPPTVAPSTTPVPPTPTTPPATVPPTTAPTTVPSIPEQPTATAVPSAPTSPPTAPQSPPSGGQHSSNVCAFTFESGQVRVDVKSVWDADRWIREHLDRPGLPDDYVPANGQMCGTTLTVPIVATPQPTITPPLPTATPTMPADQPAPVVPEVTPPQPTPAPSIPPITPDQPQPDVPVPGIPNTGDPSAPSYCSTPDIDWWEAVGQFVCN